MPYKLVKKATLLAHGINLKKGDVIEKAQLEKLDDVRKSYFEPVDVASADIPSTEVMPKKKTGKSRK